MKYEIILTEQADTDLRNIYEYIAFTLFEPGIAAGQLERIEKGLLTEDEKAQMLIEAKRVTSWVYEFIRKICKEGDYE